MGIVMRNVAAARLVSLMSHTTSLPASGRSLCSLPRQPSLKMAPHVRPFVSQHAVHHRVAGTSVLAGVEVADDAVAIGAERFDSALRAEVETVGSQSNHLAAQS